MKQINTNIIGSNNKPITLDITFEDFAVKRPVIIYAHGFNGFKDWGSFNLIAKQFVDAGFAFVKFNFSHNGTSPGNLQDFIDLEAFGNNNYTKELYDLQQVIDWVSDSRNECSKYMDETQIGLIGHSMGGGICIIKTSEDKRIKALITWASIAQCKTPWGNWSDDKMAEWKKTGVQYYLNGRTKQQMPLYYQLYEDYKNNIKRLDIVKAATIINCPFLICHGTEDTSVSVDSAHALHKASLHSELLLISSDHVFGRKDPWEGPGLPPSMQQVVDKNILFFQKSLSRPKGHPLK